MYLRFFPLLFHYNSTWSRRQARETHAIFQPSNLPAFPFFSSLSLWLVVASVLSLLFVEGVFAQEAIRIRSHEFDPDDITVGDAVQLRLRIEADENLHIYLDPIALNEHPHLEVDKPQVKRVKSERPLAGKILYEVTFLLRTFTTGTQALPPITIKHTGPDGDDGSIQTPAYLFEVRPVKPSDATEMKGIKGPWPVPQSWFLYILAGLLILIVGVLVFFYLRQRAKPTDLPPEVLPQRLPHEIAHEQLNRIEGLNLVALGEMKVYHTEISQVIRQYIAARYNIPALELTTEDLLARLHPADIPVEALGLIENFFANCDLVKFARYSPTKPEAHERLEEARRIVDTTKQFWANAGEGQESGNRET